MSQTLRMMQMVFWAMTAICNHPFRGTGITTYLENGGELEKAAQMANHSSTRTTQLYDRRADDVTLDEVERRARQAGVQTAICNHSFRGTGITTYLENGGELEKAAQMANHASPRTTQLYDRRADDAS